MGYQFLDKKINDCDDFLALHSGRAAKEGEVGVEYRVPVPRSLTPFPFEDVGVGGGVGTQVVDVLGDVVGETGDVTEAHLSDLCRLD